MILLDASGLSASRPGRPLFDDCAVTVSTGDRIAVVGLNGSGKSTLLRQLAGTGHLGSGHPGSGHVRSGDLETGEVRRGRGARVVMLDQDADLIGETAFDVAGRGWESAAILDHLGLGGRGDERIATMSGGEIKRVALARALVDVGPPGDAAHDVVLVLDEPTNHLDIDAIAWLEDRLATHRGALLLVTHDRHVLDRLTTRILELDRGRTYVHEGGYASYLEAKADREAQSDRAEDVRRNLARSELAWLRRGAPARTRKPKARIATATAIVEGKAQSAARTGELDLAFGARRLGHTVIDLAGVGHRFDAMADSPWLFRGVELSLDPRERLGIIGPNGAGKSTLLDIIAGRLAPIEGTVSTGTTVTLGVYDQRGRELDATMTVEQAVAGPLRRPDWEDARFLERFWFDADTQRAPIGLLSGGERRRLQLVLTLRQKPNVLLLDEPTNNLDLDTLRVLEDVLEGWPGAVVVISHDRAFLERTITDVLVIDEHHPGRRVPGGFGAWEAARRARATSSGRSAKAVRSARPSTPKVAAPRAVAQSPAQTASDAARPSPSTLGRRLRDVEKSIAALERRRDRLVVELDDAGGDVDVLGRVGTELATLEAELGVAEQCWLDLADSGSDPDW